MTDAPGWDRVKSVLHEALARDGAARGAYLDEACAGDRGLRNEVESLLSAHARAGDFAAGSPLEAMPASAIQSLGDSLQPGARLGACEILSKLGEGGMGEVYRARDTRLGRDVAIKVLAPEFAGDAHRRARFAREASAIARLTHPNICTLYDLASAGDLEYLVMEYVDGTTLGDRLARSGDHGLPLEEALAIAVALTDALAFAHQHGIVHRDIKPGNVMLSRSGVKLLDFGLSRLRVSDEAPEVSATALSDSRTLLGTLPYMAPEQFDGKADARTDIFAFGAVLYEMLTGRRSFDGKSSSSIISAVLNHQPPPISERRRLTPPVLDRVVRTCLEKNPDDRFQSAHDLGLELRWISKDPQSTPARGPLITRARRAIAAAVLVALAAGFAIGSWRRPAEQPNGAEVVRFTVQPAEGQSIAEAVVSPDGRQLALVMRSGESSWKLWVRSLDSEAARELQGTEHNSGGVMYPFWSPDGESIAFFANGKLKRVDIAGGPPVVICDAENGRGGTWNQDGVILFTPNPLSPLMKVSASGGVPVPVTTLNQPGVTGHRWPYFLPDGDHFLYSAFAGREADKSGVYANSLSGRGSTQILQGATEARFADGFLFFVRDEVLVAQPFDVNRRVLRGEPSALVQLPAEMSAGRFSFSVSNAGTLAYQRMVPQGPSRLTWFTRDGRVLGTIGDTGVHENVAISPDQSRVVVDRRGDSSRGLWIYEAPRWSGTRLTTPSADEYPVWSPDGARIAFASRVVSGGGTNLEVVPVGSPGAVTTFHSSVLRLTPRHWSADGTILFQSFEVRNRYALWIARLDRKGEPLAFKNDGFNYHHPAVSPDGRFVAYASDVSGRLQVYVDTFPTPGAPRVVPGSVDGREPRWRHDGRELYYRSSDGVLHAVAVVPGAVPDFGDPRQLFALRLPRQSSFMATHYDVARDGRILATVADGEETSPPARPVSVSLNATAALRQR